MRSEDQNKTVSNFRSIDSSCSIIYRPMIFTSHVSLGLHAERSRKLICKVTEGPVV